MPGRLPGSRAAAREGAPRRGRCGRRGRVPGARGGARRRAASLPGVVVPPGVDVERFTPVGVRRERGPRSALGSGSIRNGRRSSRSAASCRARASTSCSTRSLCSSSTCSSRSPATVAIAIGWRPEPPDSGSASRVRFLGRVRRRRPSRGVPVAATCSRWCAASAGPVSRPKASASSSSRPPRAGSRRSRGAAAARTKRWSTGRPGSSSTPAT